MPRYTHSGYPLLLLIQVADAPKDDSSERQSAASPPAHPPCWRLVTLATLAGGASPAHTAGTNTVSPYQLASSTISQGEGLYGVQRHRQYHPCRVSGSERRHHNDVSSQQQSSPAFPPTSPGGGAQQGTDISKISNFSRRTPPPMGCPVEVSAPPRLHGAHPTAETRSRSPWSRRDAREMLSTPQEEAYPDSIRAEVSAGVLCRLPPAKVANLAHLEVTPGVLHVWSTVLHTDMWVCSTEAQAWEVQRRRLAQMTEAKVDAAMVHFKPNLPP
jgi:hypothetical protein